MLRIVLTDTPSLLHDWKGHSTMTFSVENRSVTATGYRCDHCNDGPLTKAEMESRLGETCPALIVKEVMDS